jgi:hypothetical protein
MEDPSLSLGMTTSPDTIRHSLGQRRPPDADRPRQLVFGL